MNFGEKTVSRQGLFTIDQKGFYHTDGTDLFYGNTPKVRQLLPDNEGKYEIHYGLDLRKVTLQEVFPFTSSGDDEKSLKIKEQAESIDSLKKEILGLKKLLEESESKYSDLEKKTQEYIKATQSANPNPATIFNFGN